MSKEAKELLPCPFCLGEAKITHFGNDHTKKRKVEIECKSCHARIVTGAIRNNLYWCEEKSIEHWNERKYAEQQAKAFAEYFKDYVLTVSEIIMENERDIRLKTREVDSQYYNCDKKLWAKDMSELFNQFKEGK